MQRTRVQAGRAIRALPSYRYSVLKPAYIKVFIVHLRGHWFGMPTGHEDPRCKKHRCRRTPTLGNHFFGRDPEKCVVTVAWLARRRRNSLRGSSWKTRWA